MGTERTLQREFFSLSASEEPADAAGRGDIITETPLLLSLRRHMLYLQPRLPPSLSLPEAVEDVAIGVNPQHHVVRGGVVDEGALGVDKEHIGDPNLLHQTAVKCHTLVVGALEGQTLVLPVVTQVQSHGEVLSEGRREGVDDLRQYMQLKCLQTVYYY